jgi:hypothetical protein
VGNSIFELTPNQAEIPDNPSAGNRERYWQERMGTAWNGCNERYPSTPPHRLSVFNSVWPFAFKYRNSCVR